MPDRTDYYRVLEVTTNASQRGIREAYRRLARIYHPDMYPAQQQKAWAEQQMKLLNEAYGVLGDPQKRSGYDQQTSAEAKARGGPDGAAAHVPHHASAAAKRTLGFCEWHAERSAVALCGRCGRAVCSRCGRSRGGSIACPECFAADFSPTDKQRSVASRLASRRWTFERDLFALTGHFVGLASCAALTLRLGYLPLFRHFPACPHSAAACLLAGAALGFSAALWLETRPDPAQNDRAVVRYELLLVLAAVLTVCVWLLPNHLIQGRDALNQGSYSRAIDEYAIASLLPWVGSSDDCRAGFCRAALRQADQAAGAGAQEATDYSQLALRLAPVAPDGLWRAPGSQSHADQVCEDTWEAIMVVDALSRVAHQYALGGNDSRFRDVGGLVRIEQKKKAIAQMPIGTAQAGRASCKAAYIGAVYYTALDRAHLRDESPGRGALGRLRNNAEAAWETVSSKDPDPTLPADLTARKARRVSDAPRFVQFLQEHDDSGWRERFGSLSRATADAVP